MNVDRQLATKVFRGMGDSDAKIKNVGEEKRIVSIRMVL